MSVKCQLRFDLQRADSLSVGAATNAVLLLPSGIVISLEVWESGVINLQPVRDLGPTAEAGHVLRSSAVGIVQRSYGVAEFGRGRGYVNIALHIPDELTRFALIPLWCYDLIASKCEKVTYPDTLLLVATCIAANFQLGDGWVRTPRDVLGQRALELTDAVLKDIEQRQARIFDEVLRTQGAHPDPAYLVG